MKNILKGVGMIIVIVAIIAIIMALPTMLLWNWLMPDIFGLCKINIAQAFGLLFLSGFLFGNKSLSKKDRMD